MWQAVQGQDKQLQLQDTMPTQPHAEISICLTHQVSALSETSEACFNKSAVVDHVTGASHVIGWEGAGVVDRRNNQIQVSQGGSLGQSPRIVGQNEGYAATLASTGLYLPLVASPVVGTP